MVDSLAIAKIAAVLVSWAVAGYLCATEDLTDPDETSSEPPALGPGMRVDRRFRRTPSTKM